jgi:DNA replication and repair protein RecF
MRVKSLNLENFRNFPELHVEFDAGLNCIVGANAVGKTNLIEAIYYLSLGRSFKKAADKDLIRLQAAQSKIILTYVSETDGEHVLEATITPEGKIIALDQEKVSSVTKIIGKLLTMVYYPASVGLFRGEPAERRRFLDSTLSLLSPKYLYALTRQKKLLKERNTALGQLYDEDVINVLTNELINVSYRIYEDRKAFVSQLNQEISLTYDKLFASDEKLELTYLTDEPNTDLQDAFTRQLKAKFDSLKSEERMRKITLIGVQKDDLGAKLDGKDVFAFASQGQNRLVVLALTLAASHIVEEHFKQKPILLLDDVLSDLDETRRKTLLENLGGYEQVFITAAAVPDETSSAHIYEVINQHIERRA